jgi:hypothetical protein
MAGASPVFNPCGVAGGDVAEGAPGNGGDPPPGYKQGADGRALAELPAEVLSPPHPCFRAVATRSPRVSGAKEGALRTQHKKVWLKGSSVNASWCGWPQCSDLTPIFIGMHRNAPLSPMKEGARVHHSYGSYAPSTYGSYEPRRAHPSTAAGRSSAPGVRRGRVVGTACRGAWTRVAPHRF